MSSDSALAVVGRGLAYSYPGRTALAGVDFDVRRGEVFGFLGPNGGGKSTLFRLIATLARPDAGTLQIFGVDALAHPAAARRRLGVVFQSPSLDLQLSGRENLAIHGRLFGLSAREITTRSAELFERFAISDRAGDRVQVLSGGLRRRVEIAKALLPRPDLLALDEPSTGLDPAARRELRAVVAELARDGVTVLLSTHFLDEGDACDRLALLDGGRIAALGAPAELKAEIGGTVVTLGADDPAALADDIAQRFPDLGVTVVEHQVRLESERGYELAANLAHEFPTRITSATVARPTLEDVFVRKTGRGLAAAGESSPGAAS